MSRKLYISDLHFGHKNIIRYDNRPWIRPDEMDQEMIRRWNLSVESNDVVHILGDVVWSNKVEEWRNILNQLKGIKIIIKGNHDKTEILNQMANEGIIQEWHHQMIVHDEDANGKDRYVILNHSPMPFFVNMHHDNTYHLYGHVHISMDYQIIKHVRRQIEELYLHPVRMYNVGCMINGMQYVPRTLDEIISIDAENRKFEEEHIKDYLSAKVELGADKARVVNGTNV